MVFVVIELLFIVTLREFLLFFFFCGVQKTAFALEPVDWCISIRQSPE